MTPDSSAKMTHTFHRANEFLKQWILHGLWRDFLPPKDKSLFNKLVSFLEPPMELTVSNSFKLLMIKVDSRWFYSILTLLQLGSNRLWKESRIRGTSDGLERFRSLLPKSTKWELLFQTIDWPVTRVLWGCTSWWNSPLQREQLKSK